MNAIEWLDKQVEIAEQRAMYRNYNDKIHVVDGSDTRVPIIGARELAAEIGEVARIGYEDEEFIEEFFEYKGVRFSHAMRKDEQQGT